MDKDCPSEQVGGFVNKLFQFALAVMCIRAAAQDAPHDFRYVGGTKVDLTPVVAWYQLDARDRKSTPRPMQHWKKISIGSFKGMIGSWDHCIVTNEQGQPTELLLNNLPRDLKEALVKIRDFDARINSLQASVVENKRMSLSVQGTSMAATHAAERINAAQQEMSQLNEERGQIASKSEQIRRSNIFAMFTGNRYGGLEIWDCGERRTR